MKLRYNYQYEQDPVFQKTTRTCSEDPKRKDSSKSKDRKQDYSKQREFKKGQPE